MLIDRVSGRDPAALAGIDVAVNQGKCQIVTSSDGRLATGMSELISDLSGGFKPGQTVTL